MSIQIYLDKAIFEEKHFRTPDIRLDANDEYEEKNVVNKKLIIKFN